VRPLTVTERGCCRVPAGTITAREVAEAAVTTAFTLPIYTTLFSATGLKLVPVITTVDPIGPLSGENVVIVGTCAFTFTEKARARKAAQKVSRKVFISKQIYFYCVSYNCTAALGKQVSKETPVFNPVK
jgi:hypothetical protein